MQELAQQDTTAVRGAKGVTFGQSCSEAGRAALLLGLILLVCAGCASTRPGEVLHRHEYHSDHMGTLFTIVLYAGDSNQAQEAARAAFARITTLDEILSDYRADSELNLLREKPVGVPTRVSTDLFTVLERSRRMSRLSGGAFDATVGPYVRLWRFSRKRQVLPGTEELSLARQAVGWEKLALDPIERTVTMTVPGMRLDAGGIAKGFAADEALAVLRTRGIPRALVAASGDLAIGDPPPGKRGWRVAATEIDSGTNFATRVFILKNAGVSTSGDTEQFVEIDGVRYSHILDPGTGLGLTRRIQTTVIASCATESDALATTVCILGPRKGINLIERKPPSATLVITKDKNGEHQYQSRRWP
jgi:thiamine biosynthesis lipoprotein